MSLYPVNASPQQANKPNMPAFTFILKDAGETRGLLPVMRNLDRAGYDYAILTREDSTARKLLGNDAHLIQLAPEQGSTPLSIVRQIRKALRAPVAITGMISDFQAQISKAYSSTGKPVVGFFDGFYFVKDNIDLVRKFQSALSYVIVPSADVSRYLSADFPGKVLVLGHPTLDLLDENKLTPSEKSTLIRDLGIDPGKRSLVFVGSYGPNYEENFRLFCRALPLLSRKYNVLLSLHPSQDGQFEQKIMVEELPPRIYDHSTLLTRVPKNITTDTLLNITSGVIAPYPSTMATQSLFKGQQVFLLKPASIVDSDIDFDPPIDYGLAHMVMDSKALNQQIDQYINDKPFTREELYKRMGIKPNAAANITGFLLGLLRNASSTSSKTEAAA